MPMCFARCGDCRSRSRGNTRLAREAMALAAERGWVLRWVAGTLPLSRSRWARAQTRRSFAIGDDLWSQSRPNRRALCVAAHRLQFPELTGAQREWTPLDALANRHAFRLMVTVLPAPATTKSISMFSPALWPTICLGSVPLPGWSWSVFPRSGVAMADSNSGRPLAGGVSLSAAIGALRDELMYAVWAGQFPYQLNGQQRMLRFKPAPIEVTLQVAVTSTGTAEAGVKWWLIDVGADFAREKVATQTVKLTLEPAMFDVSGTGVELLIDTADTEEDVAGLGGGEELLDTAD